MMADKNSEGQSDGNLAKVFESLSVDKSWKADFLPESLPTHSRNFVDFQGKIRRSPIKEKESDSKLHIKRMRPYEIEDLPFGENLNSLSFQTEECSDDKCVCNKRHSVPGDNNRDFLNIAKACMSPNMSPERKLIKDSRFKLHHQVKDHKVVLRAARFKLQQTREKWYKGSTLRKGCIVKPGIFGAKSQSNNFKSLAKDTHFLQDDSNTVSSYDLSNSSFTKLRLTNNGAAQHRTPVQCSNCDSCGCEIVKSSSASQFCTACIAVHEHVYVKPGSCAEEARMDAQDYSVDELASYLDEFVYIPKKMSDMAEMMYT